MRPLRTASLAILILGGLNWGLIGLFDLDVIALLLGADSSPSRLAYVLVGLAAAVQVISARRWMELSRNLESRQADAHGR